MDNEQHSARSKINRFIVSVGHNIAPMMASDEVVRLLEKAWLAGFVDAMNVCLADTDQNEEEE